MTSYELSPRARADLSEIWDYTAETWGAEQADRYVRQIAATCADLATGRKQGRSIEDIRAGYLKCAAGAHVLFYRVSRVGTIEVMRVFHRRMDAGRHL